MIRPPGIVPQPIGEIVDFVTNANKLSLKQSYATDMRGFRNVIPGVIGVRDNGTRHRFPSYPLNGGSPDVGLINGTSLYIPNEAQSHDITIGLNTKNSVGITAATNTTPI